MPAHLVGWSDGAVVALLVARRRPDLVAYLNSPEAVTFLRRAYDPVSPDGPDHFSVVHAKMMHMIATEPEIALDTLAGITAPTLVLQGDREKSPLNTPWPSLPRCPRHVWRCYLARTPSRSSIRNWSIR